jgi:hypothetical protein
MVAVTSVLQLMPAVLLAMLGLIVVLAMPGRPVLRHRPHCRGGAVAAAGHAGAAGHGIAEDDAAATAAAGALGRGRAVAAAVCRH